MSYDKKIADEFNTTYFSDGYDHDNIIFGKKLPRGQFIYHNSRFYAIAQAVEDFGLEAVEGMTHEEISKLQTKFVARYPKNKVFLFKGTLEAFYEEHGKGKDD